MDHTRRITIPMVEQAYKNTGFRPIINRWQLFTSHKNLRCACPITAICEELGFSLRDDLSTSATDYASKILGTSLAYVYGFTAAIDGFSDSPVSRMGGEVGKDFRSGYLDGLVVYEHFMHEFAETEKDISLWSEGALS